VNDIAVLQVQWLLFWELYQNRDLLKFFHESTWGMIGLEMEGSY
jgi:hypothetical protein